MSTAATLPAGSRETVLGGSPGFSFRLDPRTQIAGFLSLAIWISTSVEEVPLALWVAAILALAFGAAARTHGQAASLLRAMKWITVAALLTILLYTLFGPGDNGAAMTILGLRIELDAVRLAAYPRPTGEAASPVRSHAETRRCQLRHLCTVHT